MTRVQAIEIAIEKFSEVSIDELKDVVTKANENLDQDFDFALDVGLVILEDRMSEGDFCNFCETL